jgi:hypothetical protein
MDRNFRKGTAARPGASPPSESSLFAQALLGKAVPSLSRRETDAPTQRAQLEWLAKISPEYENQLRGLVREQTAATAERAQLEWLAKISPRHESQFRRLVTAEAQAREAQGRLQRLVEGMDVQEAQWDPSKHPRRGGPPNAGWFATTGGAGGSAGAGRSSSFFDAVIQRNRTLARLTGGPTPGMMRSSRLANDLQSAARLPGEVARAAAAGLGTGGKAVVNASATAVKNVATLGLSTSQLELIGVTDEDRARGYDTAVAIATASGEVLIAVGTGGIASALSKGGSVARAGSGALLAFDTAGNAVGVVQGTYDALQNGVNLRNGAQVAAGALGLAANIKAARGLKSSTSTKQVAPGKPPPNVDEFVGTLPRKPTPTKTPANQYEIRHTGPYNYTVSGGGATFDIDGYRGSAILEAKHVDKPSASPYVPGSSCSYKVRTKILDDARDELRRVRTIIESGSTPFSSIEVITNSPEAKKVFEAMLKEMNVSGTVRLGH